MANKTIPLGDSGSSEILQDMGGGSYARKYVTPSEVYTPVGAHSSGDNISSAATLTKPAGAFGIIIQALTQNVRFTLDGTAPTSILGFQIQQGNMPVLIAVPGASIKVIQEAATASLQYQWVG